MGINAHSLSILLSLSLSQIAYSQIITNDSYFYGQSPPVYPSRESLAHRPFPTTIPLYLTVQLLQRKEPGLVTGNRLIRRPKDSFDNFLLSRS